MWGCIFLKKWINHNYYFTIYYLTIYYVLFYFQFYLQQLQHRYLYDSSFDYQQLLFLKAMKSLGNLKSGTA